MFRKFGRSSKEKHRPKNPGSNEDIVYGCGRLEIRLPHGHTLPKYQQRHPDYNRFLPHLVKYIESPATIIDVGANCGYVTAAMAQENDRASYICIEPEPVFNTYLQANVASLRSRCPDVQVTILEELVGKSMKNAVLQNTGGTSVAVPGAGRMMARTLDDIMRGVSGPDVRLLKSDVDGFDYDVLQSAEELIRSQRPPIYFECQHDTDEQKEGFEKIITWLSSAGYARWALFDNFGGLIMVTEDTGPVFSLMNYIMKQTRGPGTRTIYYMDIFCVCPEYVALMEAALESY